jgi:hypothetical protein
MYRQGRRETSLSTAAETDRRDQHGRFPGPLPFGGNTKPRTPVLCVAMAAEPEWKNSMEQSNVAAPCHHVLERIRRVI